MERFSFWKDESRASWKNGINQSESEKERREIEREKENGLKESIVSSEEFISVVNLYYLSHVIIINIV